MHLHRLLISAGAAISLLALPAAASAAPAGSLDSSFSGDGLSTVTFGVGAVGTAHEIARQPDGKIVTAGEVNHADGSTAWGIARYTADGTPDSGFGDGGRRLVSLGETGQLRGLAVLADGRILAFGDAKVPGQAKKHFVTLRLLSNGAGDGTNGNAGGILGLRTIMVNGTTTESAGDMAMDDQGRAHLAGALNDGTSDKIVVARLTAGGDPDTSFDGDGFYVRDIDANVGEVVNAIGLHGSRITVMGDVLDNARRWVTRIVVGQIVGVDGDFGPQGVARYGPQDAATEAATMLVLPDGRVRATGREGTFDVIYGLTAGGEPDTGFGDGGRVQRPGTQADATNAEGLLPGPDGTLYVSGMQQFGFIDVRGDLRRLRADGSPDPSFSGDGLATLEGPAKLSAAGGMVAEPDGDIVVAGVAGSALSDFTHAAFRVNGTDKPDPAPPAGGGSGTAPATGTAPPATVPAAPTTTPRATPAALRAADVIALPAARRCVSRRSIAFRLRAPKGRRVTSATVQVGRGKAKRVTDKRLTGTPVSLKGLPRGSVKVTVKVVLSSGERLTLTRTYKTCAKKKRKR